jgi:hypothetical protein
MTTTPAPVRAQTTIGAYRIVWTDDAVTVTNPATGYESITTPGSRDEYNAACDLARQAC